MNRTDDEEEMEATEELTSDSDSDTEDPLDEEQQKELWLKVKELRKQVEENSLYYDGHVSLIAKLRELFELEEARKAREKMREVYPLTPELWLEWVRDEQKVCTTDEERKYIVGLFEYAVQDYTSVQVWVEYVMFMLGGGDMEATRQVAERALIATEHMWQRVCWCGRWCCSWRNRCIVDYRGQEQYCLNRKQLTWRNSFTRSRLSTRGRCGFLC